MEGETAGVNWPIRAERGVRGRLVRKISVKKVEDEEEGEGECMKEEGKEGVM